VHLVALLKHEVGEIGAILAGNTCYQSFFHYWLILDNGYAKLNANSMPNSSDEAFAPRPFS
jgi:hypothetical protein